MVTTSQIAAPLPARTRGGTRPFTHGKLADLHVLTVDGQGRLALRGPALAMGWNAEQILALTVRDGVIRLAPPIHPEGRGSGLAVVLDSRWRVLLPYGIRATNDLANGARVIIVAAPIDGIVAALPVSRVVAALVGSP